MSDTQALVEKFVEEIRHSIRKEIIAQIANGEMQAFARVASERPPSSWDSKPTNGYSKLNHAKTPPVDPARVLEVMSGFPDGVRNSQLAALLRRGPDYIRPTLMELEEKGIVRREGVRRGTTWFRVDPK